MNAAAATMNAGVPNSIPAASPVWMYADTAKAVIAAATIHRTIPNRLSMNISIGANHAI